VINSHRRDLAADIAASIKSRIAAGEFPPGAKLPTEASLGAEHGVSRPTVRSALKELEVLGMVRTLHGVGTFVVSPAKIRSGLERMSSITDSVRESGRVPGMIYGRRTVRPVTPEESAKMSLTTDTEVLELRRQVTADGDTVAYSYDLIPMSVFPKGFDPSVLQGSVFHYFETELGIHPSYGIAEVHAVESSHIGWGAEANQHRLYILLDQLQHDQDDRLVMYSRSYFIEGKYAFIMVRRA
jgi:GntR family transcriptional regulator